MTLPLWLLATASGHPLFACRAAALGMVLLCLVPLVAEAQTPPGPPRFSAYWADGQQHDDLPLQQWNDARLGPMLGSRRLLDPTEPLRFARRQNQPGGKLPTAYVEFVGGDRLAGRVVEYRPRDEQTLPTSAAAQLIIQSEEPLLQPFSAVRPLVGVSLTPVRKVVWLSRSRGTYEPGTLYYRDGRRAVFRSLRWAEASVRLLLDASTEEVPFGEIAELHLPVADAWHHHWRQLATLSPSGEKSTLLRIETQGGSLLTTSNERVAFVGSAEEEASWAVVLAPSWSSQSLGIAPARIQQFTLVAATQLPLSWCEPFVAIHRSALGRGWQGWRADANIQGGPMQSGSRVAAWGVGVHAYQELHYELAPEVVALRTDVGLDSVVGSGGCAQVRVHRDSVDSPPLWTSPLLIGSRKLHSSPRISLSAAARNAESLILVADPVDRAAPPEADPLDVRDVVDWFEPTLLLGPVGVARRVSDVVRQELAAIDPWQIVGSDGKQWQLENRQFLTAGRLPCWRHCLVSLEGAALELQRDLRFESPVARLQIAVSCLPEDTEQTEVEVLLDDQAVEKLTVPPWTGENPPPALLVNLPMSEGRPTAKLALRFMAKQRESCAIHWQGAELQTNDTP